MRHIIATAVLAGALGLAACSASNPAETPEFLATTACFAAVKANPNYAEILKRFPAFDMTTAPARLMVDEARPTLAEGQALLALYDDAAACRRNREAVIRRHSPRTATIYASASAPLAEIYASLAQGRITWGEGVTRTRRLNSETVQRIDDQGTREMERRQELLLLAPPPSAPLIPPSQIQQPRSTNCTRFGNSVNCTTY